MLNTAYAGGATDVTVYLRAYTASTGAPKTDITNATSGLTLAYVRNRGANTTFAAASQTATGAHTDGGIVHLAGGVYRVDIPDAAVASGVDFVVISAYGVADCAFTTAQIDIAGSNPRTASLTAAEIANQTVEAEWTALKSLSRTGTNGNGGLAITMPNSGAQTSTIAVNTSASPITDFG